MGVGERQARAGMRGSCGERATPAPAGSDEILVELSLEGDRSAFEELVRRHQRGVVNYLYRLTGSRDAAMDLAQDVFLKVYQALGSFDPDYRFTTWLYRIAGNCAMDALRRRRLPTTSLQAGGTDGGPGLDRSIAAPDPSPHDALRLHELQARLERAIAALPARYRQLLLLRHQHHCRYDEIARILRLPIGTVKNRIFRAREILRVELADLLGGEEPA